MPDRADVKVSGYRELAAGAGRLADRIGEEAPKRFETVAEAAAGAARARVPRRSGALAASVDASRDDEAALLGMGGSSVPYAGWIEFGGTRGRPYIGAGRYLYPTALDAEPALIIAAGDVARDEIRGLRWSSPL